MFDFDCEKLHLPKERAYYGILWQEQAKTDKFLQDNFPDLVFSDKFRQQMHEAYFHRLIAVACWSFDRLYSEELLKINSLVRVNEAMAEDEEKYQACRKVCAMFEEKGWDGICQTFPRLQSMVQTAENEYWQFVREILTHYREQRVAMGKKFFNGSVPQELTAFQVDAGDLHNQGKTTVILATDLGKMIYKPHDLQIDELTADFCQKFFSDVTKVPAVVRGEGYGFCQFITNKPAGTVAQAKQYYYNLGGLSVVLLIMGSCDFHVENLLAEGVYPVPIDLETMLSPGPFADNSPLLNTANGDLIYSVFYTLLLPHRGQGVKEFSPLYSEDEANCSAPVIEGKKQTVLPYAEEYLQGFCAVYQRCLQQKAELLQGVESFNTAKLRIIMRGTAAYFRLLCKTYLPKWQENPHLEAEIYRVLGKGFLKNGVPHTEEILRSEVAALMRGDIPYFATYGNSLNLLECVHNKVVHENFFAVSAVDNMKFRINRLSAREMQFECDLLRKGMEKVLRSERFLANKDELPVVGNYNDRELLEEAEGLFRKIMADKLSAPSGTDCYFTLCPFNALQPMDFSLEEGTLGISFFAHALAQITADPKLRQQCLDFCQVWLKVLEELIGRLEESFSREPEKTDIPTLHGIAVSIIAALEQLEGISGLSNYAQLRRRFSALPFTAAVETKKKFPNEERLTTIRQYNSDLLLTDTLREGNAAKIQWLVQQGERALARELLGKMIARAHKKGEYQFVPPYLQRVFIPSYNSGAAGIGVVILQVLSGKCRS